MKNRDRIPFMKWPIIKRFVAPLVRESLQSLPIIGTLVTNFKQNSVETPAGTIKMTRWDWYRLLIGVGIAIAMAKGILTAKQIAFIMDIIGWPGT